MIMHVNNKVKVKETEPHKNLVSKIGSDTNLPDSGKTQEFSTGAHRDAQEGKGRFDLLPLDALTRIAKHYEAGALKYGENNWKKGMPLTRYLDSAMRHLVKLLGGLDDEDHAAAVCWNLMSFMYTQKAVKEGNLPAELNNLGVELKK
jgi:hypothetical protein